MMILGLDTSGPACSVALTKDGALVQETKSMIMAGDDSFDQYVLVDWSGYTLAQEGYAVPVGNLPYIDVTREYWSQSIHEDMSIRGKLYFAFGDHNLSTYDSVNVLLFNKAMSVNLNLDDHYETVLEGGWTLDKMQSNMQLAVNDVDGNGTWDDKKDKCNCNSGYVLDNDGKCVTETTAFKKAKEKLKLVIVVGKNGNVHRHKINGIE